MRKFVASGPAVLIAVAALAACGSNGSSKASDSTLTTAADGGDGGSRNLAQLVANASKQRYKITYTDISGNTQVYEQDGKGDSVSGNGDSQTFVSKGRTINCASTSGKATCTQSPVAVPGGAASTFLGALTLEQTQLGVLGGNLGTKSSKTIAGRDAQCVTFSAADLAGVAGRAAASSQGASLKASYSYCIDKATGVTLEMSGTDQAGKNRTVLTVTKFEQPRDSDFTPPAKPTINSLPAGVTLPTIPSAG